MAARARTKTTATNAATETCAPHGIKGTCWRCCEDDMAEFLAENGTDPARYFDGRNGEGTPGPRQRGNGGGNITDTPVETATDAQVWRIRRDIRERDITGVTVPADADIPALTKHAASKLIKRLDGCPRRARVARASTPGQRDYVRDLLAERVHADPVDVDTLTFDQASALIEMLRHATRLVDASTLADGMYRRDGVMYRVKTDKHGRKLCHRGVIVEDEIRDDDGTIATPAVMKFRSDPYALVKLTDADLMTDAQVCEFGVSYGICVYGHALTDPVSVAAGIGPKCADNAGIDQLAVAIANGYVPPVTRTRRTRKPAPAVSMVAAPVDPVDTEAYASPWSMV